MHRTPGSADPRLDGPTTGESEALAGTSGSPGVGNEYVTNQDPRFAPATVDLKEVKALEDWAVAVAPQKVDDPLSGKPGKVILMDDTVEEGIGLKDGVRVPLNATKMTIFMLVAANVTPGVVSAVGFKLYGKFFDDDGVRSGLGLGWSAGLVLSDKTIPTNRNWQFYTETVLLSTLGGTPGAFCRFEITRVGPTAGVNLVGDLEIKDDSSTLRFT